MIYVIIPSTKERRPRLEKCIAALKLNTKYPISICTYENEEGCTDVGWVKAVHKMLEGINGLVFILGDDAIVAPNCIAKLYEAYMRLPEKERSEWLLQPNEQFHKGQLATFPFCHSDVLKKYIYKGYNHLYSDTELTCVMINKKRYGYVSAAIVTHEHFLQDGKLLDETYRNTQKFWTEDKVLFIIRQKNNFEPKN